MRSPLHIHRDEHGYADAIDRDGTCWVHLRAGTERTVLNAPKLVEEFNAMLAERDRLREALDLCGSAIRCEHLHHEPRQRHDSGEPCPVAAKIAALRGEEGSP